MVTYKLYAHLYWHSKETNVSNIGTWENKQVTKTCWLTFFQRLLQQCAINVVYMQQVGGGSPEEACCVYDLVGFHIY